MHLEICQNSVRPFASSKLTVTKVEVCKLGPLGTSFIRVHKNASVSTCMKVSSIMRST